VPPRVPGGSPFLSRRLWHHPAAHRWRFGDAAGLPAPPISGLRWGSPRWRTCSPTNRR